jgi:hypothetical protein
MVGRVVHDDDNAIAFVHARFLLRQGQQIREPLLELMRRHHPEDKFFLFCSHFFLEIFFPDKIMYR